MIKPISTIALALLTTTLLGQDFTLSGTITSENEPLPFATVSIHEAETDSLLGFAYADENGEYSITIEKVAFQLAASFVGHTAYRSETIIPAGDEHRSDIQMQEDAVALSEVVIKGKTKPITMSGDKMIVDIERSGIGSGNDGLETMSKLPGVRLDKDENILFRGSGDLEILIDGKPSLLSGDALKQLLKTMDGNNIKAIEIIANPSAKYDAAGSAGVINIRLKKSLNTGLTGRLSTSVGYAEYIKNRNGIDLYNNSNDWTMNLGLSQGYNESVNHRRVVQTISEPGQTTELDQFNDWLPVGRSYRAKVGIARTLSSRASMGTSWNYSLYNSDEVTDGSTNEYINGDLEGHTVLRTHQQGIDKTLTGNVYYSFVSDSSDTRLDAQLNYAHYDNTEDRITTNRFFAGDSDTSLLSQRAVRNANPTMYDIMSAKLDLERELSERLSIESGLKYSYVENDYDIAIERSEDGAAFVFDGGRSNRLLYRETIAAAYGIINYDKDDWNYQVGLRAEYIDYEATSLTSGASTVGDYLGLFPSFSINRNLENDQYRFSYSRRIDRPRYLDLNPFFEYIDTYNVSVGNPGLRPAYTNALELTWIHNENTSISAFGNFTSDEMYQIIAYDESTQITTLFQDNIANSVTLGLNLNQHVELKDWWAMDTYLEAGHSQVKSELVEFAFEENGYNWGTGVDNSFTIKQKWTATWTAFYYDGGRYGNSVSQPSYDMSFRLKRGFMDGKFRVIAKADDVLKQSQWRSTTTQGNAKTKWTNQWETRKFTLSVTYNFGNGKKKTVMGADLWDEKGRL